MVEFEKLTGALFFPHLDLSDLNVFSDLYNQCLKLKKRGKLTREQLWLGSYYKKEILSDFLPDVTIRWINSSIGWGVFANRDFKKMDFIAEYTGKVRKRSRWHDSKNAYIFEYVLAQGIKTPYIIDAEIQGGIARYINHSTTPNLLPALATLDGVSHVILYAEKAICKGTQLCYDYGPTYWSRRKVPILLE